MDRNGRSTTRKLYGAFFFFLQFICFVRSVVRCGCRDFSLHSLVLRLIDFTFRRYDDAAWYIQRVVFLVADMNGFIWSSEVFLAVVVLPVLVIERLLGAQSTEGGGERGLLCRWRRPMRLSDLGERSDCEARRKRVIPGRGNRLAIAIGSRGVTHMVWTSPPL